MLADKPAQGKSLTIEQLLCSASFPLALDNFRLEEIRLVLDMIPSIGCSNSFRSYWGWVLRRVGWSGSNWSLYSIDYHLFTNAAYRCCIQLFRGCFEWRHVSLLIRCADLWCYIQNTSQFDLRNDSSRAVWLLGSVPILKLWVRLLVRISFLAPSSISDAFSAALARWEIRLLRYEQPRASALYVL